MIAMLEMKEEYNTSIWNTYENQSTEAAWTEKRRVDGPRFVRASQYGN